MIVDLHAKSDVGRVRRGNEDNFLLLDLADARTWRGSDGPEAPEDRRDEGFPSAARAILLLALCFIMISFLFTTIQTPLEHYVQIAFWAGAPEDRRDGGLPSAARAILLSVLCFLFAFRDEFTLSDQYYLYFTRSCNDQMRGS